MARKKNYSEALQNFNAVLKYDSLSVEAYNNRGIVLTEMGDHLAAIKDLTEAIRLQPHNAPAYFNRGNAYQKTLDFDRALADYDRAIKVSRGLC